MIYNVVEKVWLTDYGLIVTLPVKVNNLIKEGHTDKMNGVVYLEESCSQFSHHRWTRSDALLHYRCEAVTDW